MHFTVATDPAPQGLVCDLEPPAPRSSGAELRPDPKKNGLSKVPAKLLRLLANPEGMDGCKGATKWLGMQERLRRMGIDAI